ncbi:metal-dependent hydrolase [Pseudoxanthomonas sacheonensis]|uniref:Inner membrane protein n=1 Tax=Pseudoxanthomonas sacheonensis TaxID=443615 RepID=A0ABU1RP20_9GAMM|nr:metal-dependent hydrolase [Pseudoxanthomonas sacheonensis]MDR6839854.1 inner membrane protein [Pseudoxanthomonas sacheonensis]
MDSLTHLFLGGAIAAAIAPAKHRRAALLAGAALNTLPDLDSLFIALSTSDPVSLMTVHRSFSHSLFVLPVLGWLIWWLCRTRGKRVAESPSRWFWAIQLALVTHPLLDAFTVYGTQLLWPLHTPPVMGSSLFIIDPMYTVWLLAGCVIAWFAREKMKAQRALLAGLALSTAYLAWSLLAKSRVDEQADRDLAAMGLQDAPRFSVPMPLNTLLWRVVAMTPDGYVIGDRSLVADRGAMDFKGYKSNVQALAEAKDIEAVQELAWFNHGFMRAQVVGNELVLSDLRMGLEPDYNFSFVVAVREGDEWRAIPPRQVQDAYRAPVARGGLRKALFELWSRIWNQPGATTAKN